MAKMIFVNLPVRDLPKARALYEAVGATLNPQFSDDAAACMVFSDAISVMLLTHDKWAFFTKKLISDARGASEVLLAHSCESRDAVNAMADAAGKSGGAADVNPTRDYDFMFSRSFEDPDGHVREPMGMDRKGMPARE
jgi:uncharacterized protein